MLADDVLGAVGGARVDDDPAIDDRSDRVEAAPNHRCLVLDDHVKAEALPVLIHSHSSLGPQTATWKTAAGLDRSRA